MASQPGAEGHDPTHGQIDRDIQEQVEAMNPTSLGQRVAIQNTLQNRRDRRVASQPADPRIEAALAEYLHGGPHEHPRAMVTALFAAADVVDPYRNDDVLHRMQDGALADRARAVAAEAINEQLKSALDRSNRELSAHTMADLHTHGCVDCGRRVNQVMEAQTVASALRGALDKIREEVEQTDQAFERHGLTKPVTWIAFYGRVAALLDERQP